MRLSTRLLSFVAFPIILMTSGCNKDNRPYKISGNPKSITVKEFGDIDFTFSKTDFFNAGFEYGDTIDIKIDNVKLEDNDYVIGSGGSVSFNKVPFITNYNEVGYYAPCLCCYQNGSTLDISFGLNKLKNHADDFIEHKNDVTFTCSLNKKGGFNDTLALVKCEYKLSFEEVDHNKYVYANFRDPSVWIGDISKKMKKKKFYRGSSPFNRTKNNGNNDPRYLTADAFFKEHSINHELSLSINNIKKDDKYPISEMFAKEESEQINLYTKDIYGFQGANNPGLNENSKFLSVGLGSDYFMGEGKELTKKALKFIADSTIGEGNNVCIHCDEGKDRTGFFAMVVEALCGVSYRDIVADFMCTFQNYFGFSRKTKEDKLKYDKMKKQTVCRHVYSICVDKDPSLVDWTNIDAEEELKALGVSEDNEIEGILQNKASSYVKNKVFDGTQEGIDVVNAIINNIGNPS